MRKYIAILCFLGIGQVLYSCYHEQAVEVTADFSVSVDNEYNFAPTLVQVDNKSTGADNYLWTFEGGTPATSNKRQPGAVSYANAGRYTIRLEAWNNDERKVKEYTLELDSAVNINFELQVAINNISPVQVAITNNTVGAESYRWTFEGGEPALSELADPPIVTFTDAGQHSVTLEAYNGKVTVRYTRTITVLPAMKLDFEIIPLFDNSQMGATLLNKSVSGLNYKWTAPGGIITNDTASVSTTVHFATAGNYTITLDADNGKEAKSISHTLTVKSEENLFTQKDMKFGIKSAHATIGCFYSGSLREIIKKDEVNSTNAPLVDIAFFGLNETFGYCRFLSPDSVTNYAFQPLAGAQHTTIVNLLGNTPITFGISDFDNMTSDEPLKVLPITANETGSAYFTNTTMPRLILFQTADGRKGAIKIKSFVVAGQDSYVLVDIKMQKNP